MDNKAKRVINKQDWDAIETVDVVIPFSDENTHL